MKKILFTSLFATIAFITTTNAQKNVVYDANAEVRKVEAFKSVEVMNGVSVFLSQGTENAVAVSTGNEKDNASIKTEVENGTLKVYIKYESGNMWKSWKGKSAKAYITIKNLEKLDVGGASSVHVTDKFTGADVKIVVSGASTLKGTVAATNLKIKVSGASSVNLSGAATNAKIDVSGASTLKSFDLKIDNADIETSGASSTQVTVEKELNAEASGASSINYKGSPAIKNRN
jgi:Putative auto-transporter adhesin, head GIN domain